MDLGEKIKELVRLAREQGYLTYNDINEALPENVVASEELDELYVKLRSLDVEIVDQAEVDRVKPAGPEEEEEKGRLDILDDPVRMYLKQMGQVPLLSREQEVEIVDQAEVDRVKQPEPEEEEDKSRLDILDDPVRMYLKQMGQVPLLTREQEVEISKRIETAENELKRIIYGFGFAGKEHIALAEKLISEPPKERFDRVIIDKKIEGRENQNCR